MQRKAKVLLVAGFLIVVLGAALYGYMAGDVRPETSYKISVIVYGNNRDRWAFLREGLSQGSMDFPAEVSFVNMSREQDAKEQADVLKREIEGGAQGILLAASDSAALREAVDEAADRVPVLTIETDVPEANTIGYLSADNYSMGKLLGERVREAYPGKEIAVVYEYTERESVKRRYEGFRDAVGDACKITLWQRGEGDFNLSLFIEKMYRQEGSQKVVAALDDEALEAVIDAVTEIRDMESRYDSRRKEDDLPVFGIGATDKIVYYLDKGYMDGIVFQNEASIGYIGIEQLVRYLQRDTAGRKAEQVAIEYYEADKNNMYDAQIERLLFPIVQ